MLALRRDLGRRGEIALIHLRSHVDTWDAIRRIAGRADFLYVADCKLCTHEAKIRRQARFLQRRDKRADRVTKLEKTCLPPYSKGSEKFWKEAGAEAVLQVRAAYLSEDDRRTAIYGRHADRARAVGSGRIKVAA